MKRALILCLILAFSKGVGNCATTYFPPLQPINNDGSIQNYTSNITSLSDPFARPISTPSYQNLNNIEQRLFGRMFLNQPILGRLARIEKALFSTTYPSANEEQRIENIISNFNQINKYPNISGNILSKLETQILNQSYPEASPERRIERLEQQMFGATQSGDLDARYAALRAAAKNYNTNTYYNNPLASNRIAQGGWKGILGALGNSMIGGNLMGDPWGGTMTGFTPPINQLNQINPYNAYCNPYNQNFNNNYNAYNNPLNNGSGVYRGVRTNHGYSDSCQNYGSSTGVTILD